MDDGFITNINGKEYVSARAEIVTDPDTLNREYAFALKDDKLNPNFIWVSGRFVQGEKANRNGQFWTTSDLKNSEYSIRYTPLNVLHDWERPVGVFAETKLVHRDTAAADGELLPEIQALSALWASNFPAVGDAVRSAHGEGRLWYSMECIGEAKQCLTDGKTFDWNAEETCEHLMGAADAPRRLINPTFLGGALIFPPTQPGWADADIEEVAKATKEYANRVCSYTELEVRSLQHLNNLVSQT